MKRGAVFALILLLGLTCWAQSKGTLDRIGKFPGPDCELQVSTYVEEGTRVGLLGIWKQQPPNAAAAFRTADWEDLMKLWQKAAKVQSSLWEHVGVYKERGTKDPTLLTVSAGPGVRLTMETEDGIFSVVINPADYEIFELKLQQVRRFLAQ